MNVLGLFHVGLGRKDAAAVSINTIIQRLEAINANSSGISVTPENCMQSPTVQAIVQAVSRRLASLPVHVMKRETVNGKTGKVPVPDHPLQRLLNRPNDWQTRVTFWMDAASWLLRYGNFYAHVAAGNSGPARRLTPLHPAKVEVKQDNATMEVTYVVKTAYGAERVYPASEILHVRGPSRNGLVGDSPVVDMREAIALEIAAEKMGGTVFGNNAQPGMVFEFADGTQGFKDEAQRSKFVTDLDEVYSKAGRFKSMLLPKGVKMGAPINIENEKAQFLATRQYQRTVIAGGFGVPPHLVGDLTKMTFGNVEQQALDFIMSVVMPICQMFEAALERVLLSVAEARDFLIRFNLDGALRADFSSRQAGLAVQRQNGIINANEWREIEGKNPISKEDGGDEYYRQGPSGQSASPAKPGNTAKPPANDDVEDDDAAA